MRNGERPILLLSIIASALCFMRASLLSYEESKSAASLGASGRASQTKKTHFRSKLSPIPYPELSPFESAVQQQIREAQAKLDSVKQTPAATDGQLSDTYGELGKVYHAYDLLEAAKACYLNAQTLAPHDHRWLYYLARLQHGDGHLTEAIESYRSLLQIRPNDAPTLLGLAETYLDQSRPELAEPLFEKVLSVDPSCSAAMAGLGKAALAKRHFAKAITHLESSLAIDPKARSIHYPLAMAYRGVGELEKAQDNLLKRGPEKPSVSDPLMEELRDLTTGHRLLWIKGSKALRERRLAEAADIFRRMATASPQDPLARLYLGTALSLLGDRQGALEHYTEGLRIAPTNPKLHYNLALLLIGQKSDQEAIEHLQATIHADPGMKDAHFHLANELMRAGRFEQALPRYAKVIELDPGNGFARLMQAMALVRLEDYEKAKDVLEESHSALPDNVDITHALARLLAACPNSAVRNGTRAIQLIQSVVRATENLDLDQVQTLAMALAEVGQFGRAIELQESLINEVKNAQRTELVPLLTENLEKYQRGQTCRIPWRSDDPIFSPIPGTLAPLDPFKQEASSMRKNNALPTP